MKVPEFAGERPVNVVFLALSVLLLAASAALVTDGVTVRGALPGSPALDLPCFFRLLTGRRCPVCGMTRSFVMLSRFNYAGAFAMNPAGPLLYLLCVFEVPYRAALLIRGRLSHRRVFICAEAALLGAFFVTDILFFALQFI